MLKHFLHRKFRYLASVNTISVPLSHVNNYLQVLICLQTNINST